MRTLYYVPIIHSSADLGSLGKAVSQRGETYLGAATWQEHLRVVEAFWNAIARYFLAWGHDAASCPHLGDAASCPHLAGTKLYQDGMVAEGEVGAAIVAEGVKSGSPNYRLLHELMNRGAILVKTEDFALVKEELDRLLQVTRAKTTGQKIAAFAKYRLVRDRLLDKRDRFIAARIAESLGPDETGILFIGAYHDVQARLPKDVKCHEVKETMKVREYHNLLRLNDRQRARFEALGQYLTEDPSLPVILSPSPSVTLSEAKGLSSGSGAGSAKNLPGRSRAGPV
jgi:hypothetical protein